MTRRSLLLVLLSTLSAGCSAPQLRNQFSLVQLSEAVQQGDQVQLKLRLSNFGEKPIEVNGIEVSLQIAGLPQYQLQRDFKLSLPGFGIEPLEFRLEQTQLVEPGRSPPEFLHYVLDGRVLRGGLRGDIEFHHEGRLSPAPGLPGSWR